jgi:LacI family transcriptional regulator, repressor for deo operon, udp, cdd, tsx, nupC, and nupG
LTLNRSLMGYQKWPLGGTFCKVLQKFAEGGSVSGIVEIAERAGVSPATVSRALRGLRHVNEKTRSKIVAAAMELNYPLRADLLPPNANTRTNRVGVIAPYISRWYFAQAINGIEQSLREAGLDLLLYNFSEVEARARIFQQKQLRGKVDALIIISMPITNEEFNSYLSLGLPITTVGFHHDGCSSICINDVEGGRIATQHLLDLGHRDIAFLSGERDTAFKFDVSDNRNKGFLEALENANIEWNQDLGIRGDFNIYTAELAMETFLRRKKLPSAIFCHSDEMAFGALKAIRAKGMRVPEDISVIGFDDHEIAQYVGLTTVAQPPQFEGQLAAAAAIAEIENPLLEKKQITIPINLVVRQTTARI